jgi:ABC-type transport system substrate-binding protein
LKIPVLAKFELNIAGITIFTDAGSPMWQDDIKVARERLAQVGVNLVFSGSPEIKAIPQGLDNTDLFIYESTGSTYLHPNLNTMLSGAITTPESINDHTTR